MIEYRSGKYKGNFTVHNLGTGIGHVFPYIRHRQQKEDPIISNKILIIFGIVTMENLNKI